MNLHRPRGKGVCRKVSGYTKLPDNWMDFRRDSMNKKELCYSQGWQLQFSWLPANAEYVTSGQVVVFIGESIPVQNCNQEKADTRIVVHLLHALKQGKHTIYVHTVDTDVVVIIAGMIWLRLNVWATF